MAPVKYKVCRYRDCKNTSKLLNLRFFAFPESNALKWRDICNNDKIAHLCAKTLSRHHYVCADHFHRLDYTKIVSPYKTKLKPSAVPGPGLNENKGR
jgi:hypothetical protein